jgi:hypothetical protein
VDIKVPRPARSELRVSAEITDRTSGNTVRGHTANLSVAGCFVETLPVLSVVSLTSTHMGSTVAVFGEVVRCVSNSGMAIRFRAVDPAQLKILRGRLFR